MEKLTKTQQREIRKIFELVDKNGDGEIQVSEMLDCLHDLNKPITEQDKKELIKDASTNCSGKLDLSEFMILFNHYFLKHNKLESQQDLLEAFNIFDRDRDGVLQGGELEMLRKMLREHGQRLSEEEVDEIIREADIDGDAAISFQEFCYVMKQ